MLALDLQRRLDRTFALAQLAIGLACGIGLLPSALRLWTTDDALGALLAATAALVLALTLGSAALLWFAGQRAAVGQGRGLHTVLALLSLSSNPPLGTAYGACTLWTCWSHPGAAAQLAGRPPPPVDAAADQRATRYHRLARQVVVASGLFYALLGGGLLAALGPFLEWGGAEPTLTVTADAVELGGMYGERIDRSTIQRVELREDLPTITLRTNGYALGGTLKGWFQTREHGRVKLLLHTDQPPWLYLYRDGGLLIYGSEDPDRTRQLSDALGGG